VTEHPRVIDARPPERGARLSRALARGALRLAGWRIVGDMPMLPRFVVIVAPHTSNWDFPLGVAAMFALDLRVSWLGKDSLFRGPLGPVLRSLGGVPVNRAARGGIVVQVVDAFRTHPRFVLALSPEGTRRRVESWRTGFHSIARGAGVPIVPAWLDHARREIGIGEPITPSDDLEADMARLRRAFRSEMARHPSKYAE
jgi:1-acyl-sn-glycerol-3-phosphate acyltransferase